MLENRDHVYDPDPGKGFTRARLAQLQEIQKKPAGYRAQDKLHTDSLGHLKEWGKITKKKSLYTYAIAEMLYMIFIKKYLNLLITTLFFGASYKKKIVCKT